MARTHWLNSPRFTGVRWYKHPTRRFKGTPRFDRCFGIRYSVLGKRYEAVMGWESEGWTEERANIKRQQFIDNLKSASGPSTPKEECMANQRAADNQKRRDIDFMTYFEVRYLPEATQRKKSHTIRTERQLIRDWIEPEVRDKPMRAIEPDDVERIKRAILDKGLAPRTAQHALAVFRLIWNHARKRKILDAECPTFGISVGRINNQRIRFLTPDEARKLLAAVLELDRNAWELTLAALYTGARLGELTSIKWVHVDLAERKLTLFHTKTGTPRILPIAMPLCEMLSEKTPTDPTGLVFTNRDGKPWREAPWAFRHCVRALGLNEGRDDRRDILVFHSLRHTAASMMVAAGIDLRTVQSICGWSTLTMLERYTHVMAENKARAATALEQALRPTTDNVLIFRKKA